ncbi:MAG: GTP-binding protein [Candidatus Freyarchaeota archaeon]|nr:GTP-binding protein [Candidatus Jordarchaeia archaeon]MBS7269655.1 GTP-binding protein [Candidatus Jordarchaeia archaeon]MBS7280388.1 GTP-binding protein [Candidatus Jordarchaeia archaeon]
MIQGIYLIDHRGVCILHRKYGSINIDENLIGGFLAAILKFSSKLIQGEEEDLREIALRNYRIIYESSDNLKLVAVIHREDDEGLVRDALRKIINLFIESFGSQLQYWNGSVQPFAGFEEKIDDVFLEKDLRDLIIPEIPEATSKATAPIQEPAKPVLSLKQILRRSKTFMFKILLVGDSNVGKTSIIRKTTENKFSTEYTPTVGCDFTVKQFEIGRNKVRLHFWDFGGATNFAHMRKELYIDADAAILVFDLTNPESLKNLEIWRKEILNSFNPLMIFVVGNKADLEGKMPGEEGQKYAKEINAPYFETSAKTGANVEELFKSIAELLIKKG